MSGSTPLLPGAPRPFAPASTGVPAGAGGISLDNRRLATAANLDKAGREFESIFIGMMLKSMRNARLAEGLFDSKAQETFRDMQDQKLAVQMATHTPIGIGKAMTEFLARNHPVADPATAAAGAVPAPDAARPNQQEPPR